MLTGKNAEKERLDTILRQYILQMKQMNIQKTKQKSHAISWIFSAFFACSLTIGKEIYRTNQINRLFQDFPYLLGSVLETILICILVYLILEYIIIPWIIAVQASHEKRNTEAPGSIRKHFLITWVVVFIMWFPAFLAYYPGIFSYDSGTQTEIALGLINNSRFHPPLHTLMWTLCIKAENLTGIHALVIYGLLQMTLLSMALAYMLSIMAKEYPGRLLNTLSFLFIAFNPVIAVMSLAMVKDVPLAAVMILLLTKIYRLQRNPDCFFSNTLQNSAILIILCILAGLFRNNMVYALVLSFICMVIMTKKYRKEILAIGIISIYCIFLINGPVYSSLGIEKGNSREVLSIPIQQITRVVVNNSSSITEKEKDTIDNFLPYESLSELYNPRFADPVKEDFKSSYFSTHKMEFFRLWFKLFKEYPLDYINAFLDLNIPYWYLGASSIDPFSKRDYVETFIYQRDYYPVIRNSLVPGLLKWYEKFVSFSVCSKLPIVFTLPFSISTPIWLMLLCVTLLIRLGQRFLIPCLFPYIFLWLTYIAGPVSNFRYIFPMFIAYPFFVFLLVVKEKTNQEDKKRQPLETQSTKQRISSEVLDGQNSCSDSML